MALQVEFWKREIIGRLPIRNPHMALCVNAEDFVLGGSVVHIPQAGAPTQTIVNPAYPLTTVQRGDTDITYALDTFAKPVTAVTRMEAAEISYDKLNSVMEEEMSSLMDDVGAWLGYRWALGLPNTAGVFRVASTGAARAATAAGATGNRKAVTRLDIISLKAAFDKQNVPVENRHLMLSPTHINDLLLDPEFEKYYNAVLNLATGNVPAYYGFKFLQRQLTMRVAADGTVKAPNAANAVTDNEASIAWHPQMVEKALGSVKIFERMNDPEWQGDLVSFSVKNGGRRRRADHVGVGLLVDGTV